MRYLIALMAVLFAVFGFAQRASALTVGGSGDTYGYTVTGSTYTSTTADWTMPDYACHADQGVTLAASWTGLSGGGTTEQIGTVMECLDGATSYYGFYELYPSGSIVTFSKPVAAGDKIDASITYNGSSKFTLQLKDVTAAWTQTEVATLADATPSTAETAVEGTQEGTGTYYPLCASPGVLSDFTGDTVNGTALGDLDPVKVTGGDAGVTVSAVNGESFSLTCD
jgi:hypothetical protein